MFLRVFSILPHFAVCAGLALCFLLAGCAETGLRYGSGTGYFDTVVLDAGHGGHDRGARSLRGKNEKDLALDVALRTKKLLQRAGFRVVMTRSRDVFIPLGSRVATSNRLRNAIFVSIHFNWARRRGAEGLETFYYTAKSMRLAANIQQEILKTYSTKNRGVKQARFYVLRNNRKPSVLVELGFLSNSRDNKLAQSAGHRQKLAQAVAAGIIAERRGRIPRR